MKTSVRQKLLLNPGLRERGAASQQHPWLTTYLPAIGLLFAGQVAVAQSLAQVAAPEAPAEADQTTAPSTQGTPAGASGEALQEVTVTGSRVITNGNNSPTPITVVTADELTQLSPGTIANALNELPAISGSKTQDSNPTGSGSPFAGGDPSANQLNLRDLGLTATLVLLDGQRVVPNLFTDTLDVDLLPEMLVQRVDVVTGGASAVYGSDALAGVVNYVLDHNFNGVRLEGNAGTSTYGDDRSNKFGLAAGQSLFDGKIHVEASFEDYHDDGLPYRSQRPDITAWGVPGGGTAANPYTLLDNLRLDSETYGGLITNGPLKGYTFNSDGVLTPFVNGGATGLSTVQVGGDGVLPNFSLLAPEGYTKLFGRLDGDLSAGVHGHLQAVFGDKTSYTNDAITGSTPGPATITDTFSTSNPFLSPAIQSQLSSTGATTFTMSKGFGYQEMPPQITWSEIQQTSLNGGLDGKLGRFNWGLDLNYGRSALYDINYNTFNDQNLSAALDAVTNPANGQVVCHVTLTNPGLYPGCVPLNPFGPTAANSAAISYATYNPWTTWVLRMMDANAHITGDVVDTWAGPLVASLSAEWRYLSYQNSISQLQFYLNCTGLRYNCATTTSQGSVPTPLYNLKVTEPALELEVPLVKNVFLVKNLDVNLAVRAVDYSTVGRYWPWKLGPEWQITDSFRLRGTYSRDISAPTLFELYQAVPAQSIATTGAGTLDTLTGQSYPISNYNLGNPNLKAEIADTRTIGFVWQPRGTGLSITSDYYRITIEDYILQAQGFEAQYQDACYTSQGTSPFCQLIQRPSYTSTSPSNRITATYTEFFNIAGFQTWGDDTELNYVGKAFDHRYNLRILGSYQPHLILAEIGNDTYDLGDAANATTPFTGHAAFRGTGLLNVAVTDAFNFGIDERWRSPMKMTGNVTGIYSGNVFVPNHIASVGYTDVNLDYRVGTSAAQLEAYFDITNLLNTPPPAGTLVQNQFGPGLGFVAGDDPIGRYYTLGVKVKL